MEIRFFGGGRNTEYILQLQTLNSLETLKVFGVDDDLKFIPALSQLKKLRELQLDDCIPPRDYSQFALLSHLTKLSVSCSYNFVDMIRHLINLEELTFEDTPFSLDKKTFFEIVKIVKGRPNVLTLKCNFNFSLQNCSENQKVKLLPLSNLR